ncbi:MAG TPA: hypothetical protein VIM30_04220 [Candidatus Limnocylindrales bacterium]
MKDKSNAPKPETPPARHWDRKEWASEGGSGEEPQVEEPQGKTWNRHEWASDQPAGTPDEETEEAQSRAEPPGGAGPTGRGMPSGESHWAPSDDHAEKDEAPTSSSSGRMDEPNS